MKSGGIPSCSWDGEGKFSVTVALTCIGCNRLHMAKITRADEVPPCARCATEIDSLIRLAKWHGRPQNRIANAQ